MTAAQFGSKSCKMPSVWSGEKSRWKAWALKVRGYIGGIGSKLLRMMRIAEKYPQAIDSHVGWEEEQSRLDHKLYAILTGIVDGEALDTLAACEENYGLECWRQYVK